MDRYLIYKVSGGLYHMLTMINAAVNLSIKTNRILIVDCKYLAFNNDFNKYFSIPGVRYYTNYKALDPEDIKESSIFSYIKGRCSYKNGEYYIRDRKVSRAADDIINSNEKYLLFSKLNRSLFDRLLHRLYLTKFPHFPWHIRVKDEIVETIRSEMIADKYVGVHFRNTDIRNDIETFIKKIRKIGLSIVYLATDDYFAFGRFKDSLGDKYTIIQYTKPIRLKEGAANIHYCNPDKDKIIMNALIDTYHLRNAHVFIPSSKSMFSRRICDFRKNRLVLF